MLKVHELVLVRGREEILEAQRLVSLRIEDILNSQGANDFTTVKLGLFAKLFLATEAEKL